MFIDSILIHHDRFPRRAAYPFNLKVFQDTDRVDLRSRTVFFVGENGSGKSTFMEAVARKFGLIVWGGEKTHIVHRNPFETRLSDFLTLKGSPGSEGIARGFLFRSENFFNYACQIDDVIQTDPGILDYYGGKSFHLQSHGEGFLSFFENRCRMDGLYLLDEPESALSPPNQLALVKIIWDLAAEGNRQFIITTHSPILLSLPEALILSFDRIPIREIPYEETNSYRFYKGFLEERDRYLKDLLSNKAG
jgi:predicted ATPase